MEEPRWIDSLKNAPLPPAGQLTERALAVAGSRPTRRVLVLAALPLIAAVPAVALLLPHARKPEKLHISKFAIMEQKLTASVVSPVPSTSPIPELPTLARSFPLVRPEPTAKLVRKLPALSPEPKQVARIGSSDPAPAALSDKNDLSDLPAVQLKTEEENVLSLQRQEPLAQVRKLSALSAKAENVAEAKDAMEREPLDRRLAERLRFPLTPLPNAPQASVDKAGIYIHADSHHVYGDVTLMRTAQTDEMRAAQIDELLMAVFDSKGTLTGTAKAIIPASVATKDTNSLQSVSFKAFVAPSNTNHYQLGRRARFERDKERAQIIGGYRGHGAKVEVPRPDGVSINGAEFYQSNVYKDYFVRFTAVLSQKLIDRLGEYGVLTIHGAVFDENNNLLSVASTPLKYKAGQQNPDLAFGLLPEGKSYHYSFVVTQSWKTSVD